MGWGISSHLDPKLIPLVAQWIEQCSSKALMEVRFFPSGQSITCGLLPIPMARSAIINPSKVYIY